MCQKHALAEILLLWDCIAFSQMQPCSWFCLNSKSQPRVHFLGDWFRATMAVLLYYIHIQHTFYLRCSNPRLNSDFPCINNSHFKSKCKIWNIPTLSVSSTVFSSWKFFCLAKWSPIHEAPAVSCSLCKSSVSVSCASDFNILSCVSVSLQLLNFLFNVFFSWKVAKNCHLAFFTTITGRVSLANFVLFHM